MFPAYSIYVYNNGVSMRRRLCVLAVVVATTGCATGYHRPGFMRGGYTEVQLGENVFQVSFHGNGYTREERAEDFALLRSAEVAAQHGFPFFVIVNQRNRQRVSSYTTPTTTTGRATVDGNTIRVSSETSGGDTYEIVKPSTQNTILGLKDKPAGFAYEAQFVIQSMRKKYGIAPNP
jgi:hypothetical protein